MVSKTNVYNIDQERAFTISLEAVRSLEWRLVRKDVAKMKIVGKTSSSLRSWGEDITIKIYSSGIHTKIEVFSEPSHQLLDWGKSSENVDKFLDYLNKSIKRHS